MPCDLPAQVWSMILERIPMLDHARTVQLVGSGRWWAATSSTRIVHPRFLIYMASTRIHNPRFLSNMASTPIWPRSLSYMASYDAASDICEALSPGVPVVARREPGRGVHVDGGALTKVQYVYCCCHLHSFLDCSRSVHQYTTATTTALLVAHQDQT